MELRPYQFQLKKSISKFFASGVIAVIMCSPTGSGKTVTFADIACDSVKNGAVVMIAVDRKELLDQAKSKLISYGLNPSIISNGKTMRTGASCYVATVQTLKRRAFPEIDLLIIDEAHKQSFDPVVEIYKNAGTYIIGATATPARTGKMRQLSSLYDALVEEIEVQELIQQEFLVPATTYAVRKDTSKLKVLKGDYDTHQAADMFNKKQLYKDMVAKYKQLMPGTKAICFNQNVENSINTAREFNEAGISAVHVDGKTPKPQRDAIFEAFKKGMFQILCNVDIATTGFDEWSIETVIINRVTMSLPLYLQMCGRGSRITPKELKNVPGYLQKEGFNILDMGGNVYQHGFWEQKRSWSLTHKTKDKLGIAPVKECPEEEFDINGKQGCGCIIQAPAPKCKHCGYEFPKQEKSMLDGEFIEVENYQLLPPELVGKSWGSMNFEELEKVKKIKGHKHSWLVRVITRSNNLDLMDYAKFKNYEHPEAWVARMKAMYKIEPEEEVFYYYHHGESDTVWKQYNQFVNESGEEINEITKERYLELLSELNEIDGPEKIYV